MNPKTVQMGEQQRANILRELAQQPEGMRGPDLLKASGCGSQGAFSLRVCALMADGRIAKLGRSTQTRYCLPEYAQATDAAIKRCMAENAERRRLADAKKRNPKKGQTGYRPRKQIARYRWPSAVAHTPPPERRIASVWDLAA